MSRRSDVAIRAPASQRFVSVASLWEMAIKLSTGKLTLQFSLDELFDHLLPLHRIELLAVATPHILRVATLPWHHGDPFDRMLVAQALTDGLTLLSKDDLLDRYGILRVW